MRPDGIPVRVELPPTGNALPLIPELAERLRLLMERDEPSSIDLSALPLSEADLDWLRAQLGQGEVSAGLEAGGRSDFSETGYPGVWWVIHRNDQGTVMAQFLEIAWIPELLKAQADDVALARERLLRLAQDS